MNTKEFKSRSYLVRRMKDGSPLKTDHTSIHNHKIAALIFLIIDNGENFPEIVKQCETVANNLYENVETLKKSTYIQKLQNAIEAKVTKNI